MSLKSRSASGATTRRSIRKGAFIFSRTLNCRTLKTWRGSSSFSSPMHRMTFFMIVLSVAVVLRAHHDGGGDDVEHAGVAHPSEAGVFAPRPDDPGDDPGALVEHH